jgi:hypothetical protein
LGGSDGVQIHRWVRHPRVWRFCDYGLRFLAMVSGKARYRYRVLQFWEKHGLADAEAFELKRRTLYHWRSQLRKAGEDLEALNEKSRAPRKKTQAVLAPRGPRDLFFPNETEMG